MAILIPNANENLVAKAQTFKAKIQRAFRELSALEAELATFVWANKVATPQQVFDAFGKDATELHDLAQWYAEGVKLARGKDVEVVPKGKTVTSNKDGTVTVT